PEEPGPGDGCDPHRDPHRPSRTRLRAHLPLPRGDPRAGMEGSLMHLQPLMPLWTLIPLFTAMLAVCRVLLVRRGRHRPAWLRRTLMVLLLLAVALRPVTPLDRSEERRVGKGGRTRVGLAG